MDARRRDFLRFVGCALAVPAVACGDDGGGATPDAASPVDSSVPDSSVPTDGGATCTDPSETILGNHGHVLVVTQEDVQAAAQKMYDIEGGADHAHVVTLSPAHFAMLAAGSMISVSSTSGGGHTHTVQVVCAG